MLQSTPLKLPQLIHLTCLVLYPHPATHSPRETPPEVLSIVPGLGTGYSFREDRAGVSGSARKPSLLAVHVEVGEQPGGGAQ